MIRLTRLAGVALVAIVLALLGQGCAQFPSAATRKASMSPFGEINVGQTTLDQYLFDRAAAIIVGDIKLSPGRTPTSLGLVVKGDVGYGMATPIDADGHFITAAHCVKEGKMYLVYRKEGGRLSFAIPRVIWRGTPSFDLAVLSVADQVPHHFEWGSRPVAADRVVGCGIGVGPAGKVDLQMDQYAGDIIHVQSLQTPAGRGLMFSENAPNHPGDSGGPVCDLDGRLLGICVNIQGWIRLGPWVVHVPGFRSYTMVLRPDPAWLQQSILHGKGEN